MGSQQRWYTQLRYLNSVLKKYLLTMLWVGLKKINIGGWNSLEIWTTKSFTAPYAWKNKEKEQWQEPSFKRRFLIETIIFGKRIWLLLTHTLAGGSQEINSSFLHPILPLVHACSWLDPTWRWKVKVTWLMKYVEISLLGQRTRWKRMEPRSEWANGNYPSQGSYF